MGMTLLRIAAAVLAAAVLGTAAWAEDAASHAPAAAAAPGAPAAPAATADAPPAPAAPANASGPLGAVGNFIGESVSGITSGLKATGKAINDVTAPARDAAASVARLPGFVAGNERCTTAPNGAPDCHAAAEALCRAKGYEGGRSLDTQTRLCAPQSVTGGGPIRPADCVYVTRAVCR